MTKGISTVKLKRNIQSLSREKQRESIERLLRVLPQLIMEEVARPIPNEKVIKSLEKNLKMVRGLWSDYLIKHHVRSV
jgi:phosphoenolpyruvate synthase/pyruvate phosphate dikinase